MTSKVTITASVMLADLFGTVLRWMGLYLEQRYDRHILRYRQYGSGTQEFLIFKVFVLLGPRQGGLDAVLHGTFAEGIRVTSKWLCVHVA